MDTGSDTGAAKTGTGFDFLKMGIFGPVGRGRDFLLPA
jgi:hypothetical protein